jgi:hypothetical protein
MQLRPCGVDSCAYNSWSQARDKGGEYAFTDDSVSNNAARQRIYLELLPWL